jgi:hypothetical protein
VIAEAWSKSKHPQEMYPRPLYLLDTKRAALFATAKLPCGRSVPHEQRGKSQFTAPREPPERSATRLKPSKLKESVGIKLNALFGA